LGTKPIQLEKWFVNKMSYART